MSLEDNSVAGPVTKSEWRDRVSPESEPTVMRILRYLLTAVAVPLVLAAAALPASAANGSPHFIKSATSASRSGTSLVVNFKEAGLPAGSVEKVTTSATVTTVYECVNGGGLNPSASNKHSFTTTESKSGTFTANKNGNIVGSETLTVPSAGSLGFKCPAGQTVTLVSVSYSNIRITDQTSGASIGLPGTFTYMNPSAPAVR
jgi:hypothetical protein